MGEESPKEPDAEASSEAKPRVKGARMERVSQPRRTESASRSPMGKSPMAKSGGDDTESE